MIQLVSAQKKVFSQRPIVPGSARSRPTTADLPAPKRQRAPTWEQRANQKLRKTF
ncbi:hypothetical protein Q5692_25640 [Microcoleus sp. C2C3]|uniref:hypothetical protein n=1 Tax=unclassified Microcoleus TaxID=2642155 RepID=UPI002FD792FE